jgi:hypothetical protein
MKSNLIDPLYYSFNKRTSRALNQFWTGFIIYTTSFTLMISGAVSPKIAYLQLLGIIIFIIPTIQLIKFRIENKYLRNTYIIYCGWLFYIVIRGFSFNSEYLFNSLIDGTGGIFMYFVPLILLFPKDLIYLKKVINVILILSVLYIISDIIFIKSILTSSNENGQSILEYFSKILGIPCGFILLTVVYHKDKSKFWALLGKLWVLFVMILTFLLAVIRARRGLMFMSVNIILFTYIIYNYAHRSNLFFKFFPIMIIFFLAIYAINVYIDKKPGAFSLITERLKEDTRSDVEEYFYLDLNKKDWIMGKGIDGTYYCPTGATESGYRYQIETDYLQMILKGGIISLGLLLLITIPAIFNGLFYSKNILSKAAASWILLYIIDLYPATVTTFSLNYILVWISIGICYSKEIRNIPEDTLKKYFHYKIFNPNGL